MEDLREAKITKELVKTLGLKFIDSTFTLEKYDTLTLENDGEYLTVYGHDTRKEIYVPCKKKTIDGIILDEVERKVIGGQSIKTFKRDNISGIYVEYKIR